MASETERPAIVPFSRRRELGELTAEQQQQARWGGEEYRRVQRAAAQSMADQGYAVTCQGKRYEPAERS